MKHPYAGRSAKPRQRAGVPAASRSDGARERGARLGKRRKAA